MAGRRSEYRPIESRWTPSAEPRAVAEALRAHFGFDEFYIADLDAILDRRPNTDTYRELADAEFTLRIDAGLRAAADAAPVLHAGAAAVVAGLETLDGPAALDELCRACGAERIVFSLDLSCGRPLGDVSRWESDDPAAIARQAVASGVSRMIVLDLAAVGVGQGVPTIPLCRRLREEHPALRLITGGGVRGPADLETLSAAGIDQVLIASALHDGTLGPRDLARQSSHREGR